MLHWRETVSINAREVPESLEIRKNKRQNLCITSPSLELNYKMMAICLSYMMEFLLLLHCCFVYLVFAVVVNAQVNEKQIIWKLALEE